MKGILAGQCLSRTCNSACHCCLLIHWNNRFHYQTRKRNKHSLPQFLLEELLHLSFPLSQQPLPRPHLMAGQENKRTEELLSWAQLPSVTSDDSPSYSSVFWSTVRALPGSSCCIPHYSWDRTGTMRRVSKVKQFLSDKYLHAELSAEPPARFALQTSHEMKHKHSGLKKKKIYMNCRLPIKLHLSKSHSCLRQGGTSQNFIFISLMELLFTEIPEIQIKPGIESCLKLSTSFL